MRLRQLIYLTTLAFYLLAPLPAWSQSTPTPTPTPPESSAAAAEHAASERSKMFEAGLAYSKWIDGLAQNTGSQFWQRRVVDHDTWARLFACLVALVLLAGITGSLTVVVRRTAGAIGSDEQQSWFALAASALRKPLALIIWVIGGFLAFMPLVAGISSHPRRILFANLLTAILYAGRVIAVFWLIFQVIRARKADAALGARHRERAQQRHRAGGGPDASSRRAVARGHPAFAVAQSPAELGVAHAERLRRFAHR
ncbi:MAG: hypothetical protein ABI233_02125 [Chthoniobacterales bacterium]